MNVAAPTGHTPPPWPPPGPRWAPPPAPRWPRWLVAATVVWAVLLAALTWRSVSDDEPTVREQRTLAQAGPMVDRAVGEIVAAAGDVPVVLLGPDRLDRGCRITPFDDGATLRRTVELLVASDSELRPLLERIAAGLPADYRAGVRVSDRGLRLYADAGEFVTVEGEPSGPGRLRLTADTGCRPVGGDLPPAASPAGPQDGALLKALTALGEQAPVPREVLTAACPGGDRQVRTVRAETGPGPDPTVALAPLASDAVLLETPEVYAYRSGPTTVVAERLDDRVRLAATTGCAG
ncbi:hypothetical protein [Micromonospora yangpuensis]|uniref:hypothetical protein n=1 Tax=Micromonospora yangpuensis TaxID=683228 RepID=UPI001998710F|nr:hypothetical protein [Micromonospora yangpuensis]GGM13177.1 hypothetical protein GCM10012279_34190 [Micromonospora yangpuensis]